MDTKEEIRILKEQLADLQRQMREFTMAPELAPDIKRTITQVLSGVSSKTSASATQAVSESGASSYNVMKAPDGFISIGGFNVPYIN